MLLVTIRKDTLIECLKSKSVGPSEVRKKSEAYPLCSTREAFLIGEARIALGYGYVHIRQRILVSGDVTHGYSCRTPLFGPGLELATRERCH
jgi:hypothetical protein